MLRQIKPLVFQQLVNLFGLNVLRRTRDPKAKRRAWLMAAVWSALLVMVFCYMGGLSWGLVMLGAGDAVPAYLIAVSSILIFFFGSFTAGGALYSRDGYEILCSLPVSQWAVVVSRFVRMYVENLALTLGITVPGLAVYAVLTQPGWSFYLTALICLPAAPLVPTAAASLAGAAVAALSSRMKHKALAEAALSIVVVLAVFGLIPKLAGMEESLTPEMLLALADTVLDILGRICPPALWLGTAMVRGDIAGGLLAALGCFGILAAVAAAVSCTFHRICRRLFATRASHDYRMGHQEKRSVPEALCRREFRRYFSSGVYVSNTIIGPILAVVLSAALCFTGVDRITGMLPIPLDIPGLVPFLISGVLCMMTPASVSVSMEGKNLWIARSLPLRTKDLLDAKILMNLLLMAPFYLVSELFLILGLKPGIWELVWLVTIPAVVMGFSCVYGVAVNLRLPVLDWENEAVVVKQSAAAMLGGMGGLVVSLLGMAAAAAVPAAFARLTYPAFCGLLTVLTWVLYRRNNRADLTEL